MFSFAESLYGESCSEDNQCSHMLTGSKCNGICECVDGFTYVRGRCLQLVNLHGNCVNVSKKNRRKTNTQIYLLIIIMQDIDCYFGFDRESVVCAEQRCRCADGFYQRADNICRRKSMSKFFNSILNLLIFKDFFEPRCWRCMCGASGLLRRR